VAITSDAPEVFPLGETPVTWTATDDSGNSATATQTVTVVDTTPPSITAPDPVSAEQTSADGTPVDIGNATATDICDTDVAITSDAPEVFPLGETPVTWTATDDSGNSATATQTVTVVDTTAPDLSVPATIRAEQATRAGTAVTWACSATDICDADVDIVCTPPSGTVFPLGTTTVTCTGTDDSGNATNGTFTVTVADTTAPDFTLNQLQTRLWPVSHKLVLCATVSDVRDICDAAPVVAVEVTSNEPVNGPGDGNTNADWRVIHNGNVWEIWLRAERAGSLIGRDYVINATVMDASGNKTVKGCIVTVPHDQKKK
jgi:hypothetical protein